MYWLVCVVFLFGMVFAQSPEKDFTTLFDSAGVLSAKKQYQNAIQICKQAMTVAEKQWGQDTNYSKALRRMAHSYQRWQKMDTALIYFQQDSALRKKLHGQNHPQYAGTLDNLGSLYYRMGRYAQAESLFLQSAAIRKETQGENHPDYAASLNNLAILYTEIGKYVQAETLYIQIAAIKKETQRENPSDYAGLLVNLANLYSNMGKYSQAEKLYLQSIKILEISNNRNHLFYSHALNNLAILYNYTSRYAQAETLYWQSAAIKKQILSEKHPSYAGSLLNLAVLYKNIGKYAQAEKLYLQSVAIYKQIPGENRPEYGVLLDNLGVLYSDMGKHALAKSSFLQSNEILKQTLGENHPNYATSLNNTAIWHLSMGNYPVADSFYQVQFKARVQILKNNFSILTENEKKDFLALHNKGFNSYYAFSKRYNNNQTIQQVYDNVLLLKGLLLESAQQIREKILSSTDSSLKAAFTDWMLQKNKVVKYYNLSKQELAEKNINLDSLEKDLRDREAALSKKSDIFNDLFLKLVHWQDVQQQLKANEAAIEIVRYQDFGITKTVIDSSDSVYYKQYNKYPIYTPQGLTDSVRYLVLILRNSGNPEIVYIDDSLLENKGINDYLFNIRGLKSDTLSYNRFWQPIQTKLKDIQKVYISLDGVYNQLNLNTLYNIQEKKYLNQKLQIIQLASTRDLIITKNKNKKPANNKIYLFGNPKFDNDTAKAEERGYFNDLPGAAAEVTEISNIKGLQTVLKTGKEVTEAAVKSLYNPAVLHIATHGYYEKNITSDATDEITLLKNKQADPMLRSGLVLSGGGTFITALERGAGRNAATTDTDDGILTAFEAQNLHLDSTELVVLSACQTGVGEIATGEGVYGLQRGFQIAGANYLIMSLWNVNDETTRLLMTTFYKEWAKTKDIRKSFEIAQSVVKKQYPQPKYWGAFVLLGK